jgi:uncharacterized protein YciI
MNFLFALLLTFSSIAFAQDRRLIFVFLHRKEDKTALPKEEIDRIMAGHMANIQRLAKEGKLVVAGPFEGGGGIFIFNSDSPDLVKEWLSTDPGVKANRWNIEVVPYQPRRGSACVVGEPIQMVMYEFIRYKVKIAKYNVEIAPEIARRHDDYLRKIAETGNIVSEGLFGEDGGILIMKGDLQKELIMADPSLSDGLYQIEFKKLYVAKGAFCEK